MDASTNHEWMVRTRPSKNQPSRTGFVDPVYLSSRLFTPSPAPSSVTSQRTARKLKTSSTNLHLDDSLQIPDDILLITSSLMKSSKGKSNRENKKYLLSCLIQEETEFINKLRRACHVINNFPNLPAAVDCHSHVIFGDLQGIEQFHSNILLPGIMKITDANHLPHLFLQHSSRFEELHLSHVINTFGSGSLIHEDDDVSSGLYDLSRLAGVDMAEITQQPMQQLTLYQYYLKKLLLGDCAVRPLEDAMHMLSDVPYKANMTRVWGGMCGRPSDTSAFGQLIKEGILHLVAEEGERCKSRHRRLFLFQNYLIVAKIHKVARTKQNDESLFDQMHETKGIMLEDDCDVRSFIIRSSSDRLGVALWSMRLECRSSAGKKSWRREIGRIIMEAKNGCKQGPLFTIKLCDVTINEGDTMHLFCYVTGIPPPEVAWMKDDVAVVTGTRMTSSSRDDGYRGIHLSNVTRDDAGKYTCCVISDASVMTSAYVTIRDGGS